MSPNSTYDINAVFSRNADNISSTLITQQKRRFSTNMTAQCQINFYDINAKKRDLRSNIQREYSNYMSKVIRHHSVKNQSVQRIMRSFKVKQLVRYCEQVMLSVHLDAQKVQAIQTCQRLRTFSQYFTFAPARFGMTVIQKGKPGEPRKDDYQVFKYETNKLIENFTYPYMPPEEEENELEGQSRREVRVLSPDDMQILDYSGIPSSANLVECEASSIEELREYKQKLAKVHLNYNKNWQEDLKNLDVTIDHPEKQTKEMLPTMTPRDPDPSQGKGKPEDTEIDKLGYPLVDYEEALQFGQSQFARMFRYYQYLERIISLEWFICKL